MKRKIIFKNHFMQRWRERVDKHDTEKDIKRKTYGRFNDSYRKGIAPARNYKGEIQLDIKLKNGIVGVFILEKTGVFIAVTVKYKEGKNQKSGSVIK